MIEETPSLYALPIPITDPADCYFYHTVELPGFGLRRGEWDLRGRVDAYLGGIEVEGKPVLEVGAAGGFLGFEMERRGACVVAYDLSPDHDWDIVPYGGQARPELAERRREHIQRINNAWWLTHRLLGSRARMVHGTAYEIPPAIGDVQVSTLGCILLHLRDPFLALQRAAALTTEALVVTEVLPDGFRPSRTLAGRLRRSLRRKRPEKSAEPVFLPDPEKQYPAETWWALPPALVCRFLKVLGFASTEVSYHRQFYREREMDLYTVVGRRV